MRDECVLACAGCDCVIDSSRGWSGAGRVAGRAEGAGPTEHCCLSWPPLVARPLSASNSTP